jgi:hypothetical protein
MWCGKDYFQDQPPGFWNPIPAMANNAMASLHRLN